MRLSATRAVLLITRREFLNRVKTRAFVVGTAVLVLILAGYMFFFTAIGSKGDKSTLGVTPTAAQLAEPLKASAAALGQQLEIRQLGEVAGEQQVRDGDLQALLTGAPGSYRLIGKDEVGNTLTTIVRTAVAQAAVTDALRTAGVDPQSVAASANVQVIALQPPDPDRGGRLVVGLVIGGLLYLAILIYGQTIAQGVVEEKTSRVIELLLSTVKPWQLMLGKVIGVGAAGLLQFTIIGVIAAVAVRITGVASLPSATLGTVLVGLLWFILGFFLYATLFAAAGSLVSRSEDLQAVVTPITILVLIPFLVSFTIIDNPTGPLAQVLSVVPFFAPILMPVLFSLGAVAGWQLAVALALTVVTIGLIALL
ncbi:MAG: ABC-type Na+ efflux pump permease component, partial [Pseudonocardia sp.]|nr:ABC-type Na+ efflux pump permease component [Pseudonocardia sp.]